MDESITDISCEEPFCHFLWAHLDHRNAGFIRQRPVLLVALPDESGVPADMPLPVGAVVKVRPFSAMAGSDGCQSLIRAGLVQLLRPIESAHRAKPAMPSPDPLR